MLVGILLALSWLVLLLRYPSRALGISAMALCGLLIIVAGVAWQDWRESRWLTRVTIQLQHHPELCPPNTPLQTHLHNGSPHPLEKLHWQVTAHLPGSTINIAQLQFHSPHYQLSSPLLPNQHWQGCLPLPTLRPGYRPKSLIFTATQLEARFVY